MLIPAVSVIVSITLLPALLSLLGHRINKLRVMPKRFVTVSDPESGWWGRWGRLVVRRPWPIAAVGLVIVGVLISYGLQLNPSEAQAKDFPGKGDAIVGRDLLSSAGISPGVIKPFIVLTPVGEANRVAADRPRCRGSGRCDGSGELAQGRSGSRRSDPERRRLEQGGARDDLPCEGRSAPNCKSRWRRAGGPRLRARGLRQLPLRPAVRDLADLRSARARVPLVAASAEGRDLESGLARSGVRDHRLHLPAGPRLGGDLGGAGHPGDHRLDSADDLRVPVWSLDGLRGLHAHSDARSLRRDEEHQPSSRARARSHGQARDERRARADVRLLRALDEPGHRHQAVRHRLGCGDHLRCDRDPSPARSARSSS